MIVLSADFYISIVERLVQGVRISSTFSVLRPFSYIRLFLCFDPRTLRRPKFYFDLNLTSTFLSQLYFDFLSELYFDLFVPTLLRPKLYFGLFGQTLLRPLDFYLYFSTNKKSTFDTRSKYYFRLKRVEVKRMK